MKTVLLFTEIPGTGTNSSEFVTTTVGTQHAAA